MEREYAARAWFAVGLSLLASTASALSLAAQPPTTAPGIEPPVRPPIQPPAQPPNARAQLLSDHVAIRSESGWQPIDRA